MKRVILTGYGLTLSTMLLLQSCEDGPIVPNTGTDNTADTTWFSDSTDNGDGSNNGESEPADSTNTRAGSNGGNDTDTTTWEGGDPFDIPGGN